MKNEKLKAVLSVTVFILCLCLTFPFVTGLCSFTSIKDSLFGEQTTATEDTFDPYDPYGPGGLFSSESVRTEPVNPLTDETASSPETTAEPSETTEAVEITSEIETQSPETSEVTTTVEITTVEITTSAPETEALTRDNYPWIIADADYFSDALFVGDSNVNGLRLRCGEELKTATFFAKDGLMCSSVLKEDTVIPVYHGASSQNLGDSNFETLVKSGNFKKFYLMFGANESGYADMSYVENQVARIITMVKQNVPDAVFCVEATLLGTKAWSASHKYDRNGNILKINTYLSELADWHSIVYIDANELFGDGNGNLDTQYSNGYHLNDPKHYRTWSAWIATKGINLSVR